MSISNVSTIPRSIPDMAQALADLRDLFQLAESEPDTAVKLRELVASGAPLLRAYVDGATAPGTSDFIVRYEIADQVKADLAALRVKARNGGAGIGECGNRHGHLLSVTPEMIKAGAAVLFNDPFLNVGPSIADAIAKEVIECALEAHAHKTFQESP